MYVQRTRFAAIFPAAHTVSRRWAGEVDRGPSRILFRVSPYMIYNAQRANVLKGGERPDGNILWRLGI